MKPEIGCTYWADTYMDGAVPVKVTIFYQCPHSQLYCGWVDDGTSTALGFWDSDGKEVDPDNTSPLILVELIDRYVTHTHNHPLYPAADKYRE